MKIGYKKRRKIRKNVDKLKTKGNWGLYKETGRPGKKRWETNRSN